MTCPLYTSKHNQIRSHFPLLENESDYVYFDSAATTLKPKRVLEKLMQVYSEYPMNIRRGAHRLSEKAWQEYEETREVIRAFLNVPHTHEIVFTKGTTESLNLLGDSFGKMVCQTEDEILISPMEHHSNFAPWKRVCEETGAKLRFLPITADGEWDISALPKLFSSKTKFLALAHVSHVLGTINPITETIALAHKSGIPVVIDGAQAMAHIPIDLQLIDADFYCFSGHKLFAPFGVGVLIGRKTLLDQMSPYQIGGGVIEELNDAGMSFISSPEKFEAGTPPISSIIALKEAIHFINEIGFEEIESLEKSLANQLIEGLQTIPECRLYGPKQRKIPLASFTLDGIHPHDLNTILDQHNIAIRSGHLCAQPLMRHFHVSSMNRASLSFYNTPEEIVRFIDTLRKISP